MIARDLRLVPQFWVLPDITICTYALVLRTYVPGSRTSTDAGGAHKMAVGRPVRTPPEYRRTTSAEPPLNCLTRDSIMVIHVNAISIQDVTFTEVALRLQRTNTRPASGLVSECHV